MKLILKYLRLYFLSFKLRFSENVAYRTSLFSHSFAMICHASFRVIIVLVAAGLGQGIVGWSTYQLVLFAGVHQVFISFMFLLVYRQINLLIRNIYYGQLEHDLLKPVDSQLAIALKGGNLNNLFGVFLGLIIIIFSCLQLSFLPSLFHFLAFFLALIFSLLIIYASMFLFSILNFWSPRLDNAQFFGMRLISDPSRFPASAYHQAGTLIYLLLLPITLTTTVPAQILLQQTQPFFVLTLIFSSLLLFFLSRRFWHFALKHYTSASS